MVLTWTEAVEFIEGYTRYTGISIEIKFWQWAAYRSERDVLAGAECMQASVAEALLCGKRFEEALAYADPETMLSKSVRCTTHCASTPTIRLQQNADIDRGFPRSERRHRLRIRMVIVDTSIHLDTP